MDDLKLPGLRRVDVLPVRAADGELYFALHDHLRIAPQPVAVTLPGYFLLAHLDGRHTLRDLQVAFLRQFGQMITRDQLRRIVSALDDALLLDNERFDLAYTARRDAYLAAAARDNRQRWPPADRLRRQLEQLLADARVRGPRALRGVIAPHLDYGRGGPCYALAYRALADAQPAERYVILGTNHFGRARTIVATRKDFHTPLGRAPTDRAFIERLERRLGSSLCDDEFDHETEHSVELQVHLLQVCRPDAPFSIVPVLCSDPFAADWADAELDARSDPPAESPPPSARRSGPDLAAFADALAAELAEDDRPTVVIAGADFSHVGQRFGDPAPTTPEFLAAVEQKDRRLLSLLESHAEEEFLEAIRAEGNRTRICSVGCLYALLRALPQARCRVLKYHQAVNLPAETHVTCAAALLE